jgi:hypothetical protein
MSIKKYKLIQKYNEFTINNIDIFSGSVLHLKKLCTTMKININDTIYVSHAKYPIFKGIDNLFFDRRRSRIRCIHNKKRKINLQNKNNNVAMNLLNQPNYNNKEDVIPMDVDTNSKNKFDLGSYCQFITDDDNKQKAGDNHDENVANKNNEDSEEDVCEDDVQDDELEIKIKNVAFVGNQVLLIRNLLFRKYHRLNNKI